MTRSRSSAVPITLTVVALIALIAFVLWYQFGDATFRDQFTVTAKKYVAVGAAEDQNWQFTAQDGRRFYTDALTYQRVSRGDTVTCTVTGRSLTLPLLPDHLQQAKLCKVAS